MDRMDANTNCSGYMTIPLFDDWLMKLDEEMQQQGCNIALIIDSAPGHGGSDNLGLTNITIVRMPPGTTSLTAKTIRFGFINVPIIPEKHEKEIRFLSVESLEAQVICAQNDLKSKFANYEDVILKQRNMSVLNYINEKDFIDEEDITEADDFDIDYTPPDTKEKRVVMILRSRNITVDESSSSMESTPKKLKASEIRQANASFLALVPKDDDHESHLLEDENEEPNTSEKKEEEQGQIDEVDEKDEDEEEEQSQ
ncbi:hypothetical protein BGZ65_004172, partial [Modicella reniformis]